VHHRDRNNEELFADAVNNGVLKHLFSDNAKKPTGKIKHLSNAIKESNKEDLRKQARNPSQKKANQLQSDPMARVGDFLDDIRKIHGDKNRYQ